MIPEIYSDIAAWYAGLRHGIRDTRVAEAYRELGNRLKIRADNIRKYLRHELSAMNPYRTVKELRADVIQNRLLMTLASDRPHWAWSARDNDTFRLVHDYIGHARPGHSFGVQGEILAFREQLATLPGLSSDAAGCLANETIGQQACFYAGEHASVPRARRPFPKQVATILDPCFWRGMVS